jgi:alcohol dehydrogenase class IV
MINESIEYYMPVNIQFGTNKINEAGALVARLGKKALLVTGKRAMKKSGATDRLISSLQDSSVKVTVFDDIFPNPTDVLVDMGAGIARKNGCDVIVGLGGGSAMDAAKGIAVVAALGGSLWGYIGENKVTGDTIPMVAIPTTAGTGSETTPYAVFTNPKIHRKDAVVSQYIFPRMSIVDPAVMKTMPPSVTADTGFDALGHAIEAYMSILANPFADACSYESVRLIGEALVKAVRDGNDLEARGKMAIASSLAGMAIAQVGVVAGHGFAMAIGGLMNTSHGRTVGILLPHVMNYNLNTIPDKIARLAPAFDLAVTGDSRKNAENVISRIKEMMKDIDYPTNLGALGVRSENLQKILDDSMNQEDIDFNPRKFDRISAEKFIDSIL